MDYHHPKTILSKLQTKEREKKVAANIATLFLSSHEKIQLVINELVKEKRFMNFYKQKNGTFLCYVRQTFQLLVIIQSNLEPMSDKRGNQFYI